MTEGAQPFEKDPEVPSEVMVVLTGDEVEVDQVGSHFIPVEFIFFVADGHDLEFQGCALRVRPVGAGLRIRNVPEPDLNPKIFGKILWRLGVESEKDVGDELGLGSFDEAVPGTVSKARVTRSRSGTRKWLLTPTST